MKQLLILFDSMGISRIIIDKNISQKRILEVLQGAIIKIENNYIKIEINGLGIVK